MKIKVEKSYVNCYYIMLLSVFIMGYTLRSSILPGVIGYINIPFYICMSIILLKWAKYINQNIIVTGIILCIILYVDIKTGSDIDKIIVSMLGFVIPLSLFSVDYKRIVKNKHMFLTKSIKILNLFVVIMFMYMLIDLFTGCAMTKALSVIFPKLAEYIPTNTGFLQFRSASYLGHELYTKHFIIMFYMLNMLYYLTTSKYLINIIVLYGVSVIGIALSGSKLGILILLFLIVFFNLKSKNKMINFTLIFLGLLILAYLGIFDYVINRFTTTTFTTGRSQAWELVATSLPNLKAIGGLGEGLMEFLRARYNDIQVTAAFEYPFKIWMYRYGWVVTALILYQIYACTLYKFIKGKSIIFILSFLMIIGETSSFNQLVYNPDLIILVVLWNIILSNMFDLYEENKNILGGCIDEHKKID